MTRAEIDAALERVKTWQHERQEDAAEVLIRMEKHEGGIYELDEDEAADLEEALAEEQRGEIATQEQVRAVFNRYG